MPDFTHTPVLLKEVLSTLKPKKGDRVLDCTLGLGGHAAAILKKIGVKGQMIGLDTDERNLTIAEKTLKGKNVQLRHANFGSMPDCLPEGERTFDIIFADLGLSSPHLDDPERGFSFKKDSPLDMRFDLGSIMTAEKILLRYSDEGLTKLFREEGELPLPHKLTAAIRRAMKEKPMQRSGDLNEAVNAAYGFRAPKYLPQVYQALRMAVNRELAMLENFLREAPNLLKKGGRFGVISFHSLEDRMVKQAFRSLSTPVLDQLTGQTVEEAPFAVLTKKATIATAEETTKNPRARSAKFRAVARVSV